jgi:hypothetical protein
LEGVPALALFAELLVLGFALHRLLADQTALAVETAVAAAAAESFPRVRHRHRQLHFAVATALACFVIEIDHGGKSSVENEKAQRKAGPGNGAEMRSGSGRVHPSVRRAAIPPRAQVFNW